MRSRALLAAYVVASIGNVVGQLVEGDLLDWVTKPLLVPLLLAYFLSVGGRPTGRLARATALGLVFCWFGDVVLMAGDDWFLVGLGCFLVGQIAYCAGFATTWSDNPIRSRTIVAAPYLAWWALLLIVLDEDLGGLIVPVAIYGAVLCAMAGLALGVHRLAAIGAISFVVSDSVLAATSLSDQFEFGGDDALVMATYVVGQLLIVLGVLASPSRTSAPRT